MRRPAALLVAALLAVSAARASADTFEVSKASMTLPVTFQTLDKNGKQVLATKTLKTADIVNLALGRPLSTKLDKATETLALAGNASTPGAGSKIVVFNPTAQTITATVCDFGGDFVLLSNEDFSKNAAYGSLIIQTTTLGDPVHDGFQTTTITGAATGKAQAVSATTALIGPVKLTFTDPTNGTQTIGGIVLKGKFKSGGFLAVLP